MNNNQLFQSLLLHFRCNYNQLVIGNYNLSLAIHVIKNFKMYKKLSYPFITKGDLRKKGSKFVLRRPDLGAIMFYEVLESTITDYYSRFRYYIYKTIPETFNYIHQVEIRYINEDECDLRACFIYDNKVCFTEREYLVILQFIRNFYQSLELSIRKFSALQLAITSTVINVKIDLIWNIIKNMKMIHKYVNLLGNKINYNGNLIKKNGTIELIDFNDNKKAKLIAKIKKCKISKANLTSEGVIEFIFKKDNSPFSFSKIILRIYEFNGLCTMYIFYHFVNIQDYYYIRKFTEKKEKEVNKLKYILENYTSNVFNNDQ